MFKIIIVSTMLIGGGVATDKYESPRPYYDTFEACEEARKDIDWGPNWTVHYSECTWITEGELPALGDAD